MNRKLFFKICFFLPTILFLIAGCTVKNPLSEEAVSPVLSDLVIPDTVYLKTDIGYPISVKVSDPQGLDDVKTVRYSIFTSGAHVPVLEDTLKDDGREGDIIARDGVFFDLLTLAFTSGNAGLYQIKIFAEDSDDHLSNTIYDTLHVVDGEKNFPPTLNSPVVPDTLTEKSLEDVFLSVRVSDLQGLEDIDTVFFQIYPSFSPVPLYSWTLWDNGASGDEKAGDGIFSFWGNLVYALKINGDYFIRFQAVDKRGLKSTTIVVSFTVVRPNDPPVFSELSVPDVVSLSAGHFTVSVKIDDPQGLEDIKRVYFNSTKPDGTPAGGNPFRMYDDGDEKHGDEKEDDGWYSLEVEITKKNEPGDYRFEFFAEDQSGAVSQSVTHTITVIID